MGLSDLITQLPELIGQAVEANQWLGYTAIFAAMFLENLFPPIPSELIMPLGGFYVQQGQLDLVPVVLAGLLGTVFGALPWYGIGRLINEERIEAWLQRHGRWIGISADELARSRRWFSRYGTALVFWGRLVPGIRTLISVPAGIEMMPMAPFLVWTTAGSLIWTALLTVAGMVLGEGYSNVELWIDPVSKAVKVLLVVAVLAGAIWLGLRIWRRRQSSDWSPALGLLQAWGSEGDVLIGGLAAKAAGCLLVVAFGAEQFEPIHTDHGLAALFAAGTVGPAVQLEAADDAEQGALLHVIRSNLGLLAPDFEVEPVGFIVAAATVHRHGEVGHHAAGLEVTHFGIAAGTANEGDGINAHRQFIS